jgi:hypothetical protein
MYNLNMKSNISIRAVSMRTILAFAAIPPGISGYSAFAFRLLLSGCFVLMASASNAQITGTVFRDYDGSGIRGTMVPNLEPGVAGVIVNAYNTSNAIIASYVTNASGAYSIPASGAYNGTPGSNTGSVANGVAVRLEFEIPVSNSNPTGPLAGVDFSSNSGGTYGSSVQFVSGGATNVNYAINAPNDYCQNTDPNVAITCFFSGDPLLAGTAAAGEVLVAPNWLETGSLESNEHLAIASQMGSVYGLAYHRQSKKLFSSAFLKRHSGLGPQGLGGIYETNINAGLPGTVSNFADLENAPFNINFGAATIAGRTLPANAADPSNDPTALGAVGKIGIGDIEVSDDGQFLYVVNLYDRQVYALNIGAAGIVPTGASLISGAPWTTQTCPNGTARPFALKYYRGKLYVGVVCTGESGGTVNDLSAWIYAYDGSSWTTILNYSLNFAKQPTAYNDHPFNTIPTWLAWTDNWITLSTTYPLPFGNQDLISYPQPMLVDIEFDDNDGALIMSFADRIGHQVGFRNNGPTGTGPGGIRYGAVVGGDILRAGRVGGGIN